MHSHGYERRRLSPSRLSSYLYCLACPTLHSRKVRSTRHIGQSQLNGCQQRELERQRVHLPRQPGAPLRAKHPLLLWPSRTPVDQRVLEVLPQRPPTQLSRPTKQPFVFCRSWLLACPLPVGNPDWRPLEPPHPQRVQQLRLPPFAEEALPLPQEQRQLRVAVPLQKLLALAKLVQHRNLVLGLQRRRLSPGEERSIY